jgi:hypothetical protein
MGQKEGESFSFRDRLDPMVMVSGCPDPPPVS